MSKRIITLGTWNGEPIKWLVLKEESFGTLVISQRNLFKSKFDDRTTEWKKSYIREYLNGDFYNNVFTQQDKTKIVNVKLADVGDSKDNVFY